MKYPPALNPLRRTQFSWLLPLTWALIECAAVTLPITVEVFIHRRFGVRTGKALLKGFVLLYLVYLPVSDINLPRRPFPIYGWFVFAYAVMALWRWAESQREQPEGVHSYSTGEPLAFWQQLGVPTEVANSVIELIPYVIVAGFISFFDPLVTLFMFTAGFAFCVQELVRDCRIQNRQLDAADSRAESQQLTPRHQQIDREPFVEVQPATPRQNAQRPRGQPGPPHRTPPPRRDWPQ